MSQIHRRTSYAVIVGVGLAATLVSVAPAPASPEHQHCGPTADTVAPMVTNVALSKTKVDVRKHDRQVTITVDAHDVAAGTPIGIGRVRVLLESGRKLISTHGKLSLVSGTTTSGEWQTTVTVPTTSLTSTWFVASVVVSDIDGNTQRYDQGRYGTKGPHNLSLFPDWPTHLKVTGQSAVPTVDPGTLRTLTLTKRSVDTTAAPRNVGVTATFSGPAPTAVRLKVFPNPSGHHVYFAPIDLTPGAHGLWTGTLTIRRWLRTLTLNAEVDAQYGANSTRLHRKYRTDDLQQLGLPSSIHVISGTDNTNPTLTDLTVTPTTIDTTTAAQPVTITATVADDKSGVTGGDFHLSPHVNANDHPVGATYGRFTVNGDQLTGTATIARCVIDGTWQVGLEFSDAAGNEARFESKDLTKAGFPGKVTVISDPPGDRSGPRIKTVTSSAADHTVTVTFRQGVKDATVANLPIYQRGQYADTVPATAISCSDGTTTVPCDGSGGLAISATLTAPDVGAHHYLVFANEDSVVPQVTDVAGNPVPWPF